MSKFMVCRAPASRRLAVLVIILAVLVALKIIYRPPLNRNVLDGSLYYHVAGHIANGDGLVTSVSLYHQGLKDMPCPSTIYPLWPLVLGGTGRLLGLPLAADLLSRLFGLLALVLLYPLANRAVQGLVGRPVSCCGGWLDAGHFAVLLLGFNPVFFWSTTFPYSEGLAFALTMAALLAMGRGRWQWDLLAGALAGAAYLARSQMIGLVIGCLVVPLLGGLNRRSLATACRIAAGTAVVVLPWFVHLARSIPNFSPVILLDFAAYRQTPELPPFEHVFKPASAGEWVLDRSAGLWLAFHPTHPCSYLRSFGPAAWVVPLALFHVVFRPGQLQRAIRALRSRAGRTGAAMLAGGALMLAPVHLHHSTFFLPWLFGFRHGLPFIFLLTPSLGYLLAQGERGWRWLVLTLVFLSLLIQLRDVAGQLRSEQPGLSATEKEAIAWLNSLPKTPIVAVDSPQVLSVFSTAHFHWLRPEEPAEYTRLLIEKMNIDYLLIEESHAKQPYVADMEKELRLVKTFGEPPNRLFVFEPIRDR